MKYGILWDVGIILLNLAQKIKKYSIKITRNWQPKNYTEGVKTKKRK